MATFESSLKSRLIYIFAISDDWHKDCLKIGETTLEEDNGDLLAPNDPLMIPCCKKRPAIALTNIPKLLVLPISCCIQN